MPICCHKIFFWLFIAISNGGYEKLSFLPIHINLSFGSFAYAFFISKSHKHKFEEHWNALRIFYNAEYWKIFIFIAHQHLKNFFSFSILNFTSDMQKYCRIQDKLLFACEQKSIFCGCETKKFKIMTDIWGVNERKRKVLLKDWLKSFFGVDGDDAAALCWMRLLMELHNFNIEWSCKVFLKVYWFIWEKRIIINWFFR